MTPAHGPLLPSPGQSTTPSPTMTRFHRDVVLPNLRAGALAVTRRSPRAEGIEAIDHDPVYENLYDRAYALLSDGAELEHLAVAAVATGSPHFTQAVAERLARIATAWADESRRPATADSVYATSRLLKGLAVAFDIARDRLPAADRHRVERLLVGFARTMWDAWFAHPPGRGPVGHVVGLPSPHHASVEWSSFGIVALALLDVASEARTWLDAAIGQFEEHLLPHALEPDGAPPEGAYFWLSTMFSRIQFLDLLHHRTGRDLAAEHEDALRYEMADALVVDTPPLGPQDDDEDRFDRTTRPHVPSGHGSVLLWLASRFQDPHAQLLALTDARTGCLEAYPAATPTRRIRLRQPINSYAPLWIDTSLEPASSSRPTAAAWPSISLCARGPGRRATSDHPPQLTAAIDRGRAAVWLGHDIVWEDLAPRTVTDLEASRATGSEVRTWDSPSLRTDGIRATAVPTGHELRAMGDDGETMVRIMIGLDGREAMIERRVLAHHPWRTTMALRGGSAAWHGRRGLTCVTIAITGAELRSGAASRPDTRVGYGLLTLHRDTPAPAMFTHDLETRSPSGVVRVCISLDAAPG